MELLTATLSLHNGPPIASARADTGSRPRGVDKSFMRMSASNRSGFTVAGIDLRNSLSAAECGIRAIGRPCQAKCKSAAVGLPHPRNPICRSPGEAIYVIDDDADFLEEVAEQLSWIGVPVSTFSSAVEFQNAIRGPIVGCVLVDIRMPTIDGISLHEWLRSIDCLASVVFLSGASNVSVAVDRMKAGALDFLVKPLRETELVAAVTNAISHSRMRYCTAESAKAAADLIGQLTPAEMRVAELISDGYVTKQIAALLDRSENTIKIHKHKIMNKIGANSTAALVKLMSITNPGAAQLNQLQAG